MGTSTGIMKIAVLLTCYNRKAKTLASLATLSGAQMPDGWQCDLFLVDDASPDGTGGAVGEAYPAVHVIEGTGHLYWNRGMLLAWQTAVQNGEYDAFLWLNDDVLLSDDALLSLRAAHRKMPGALICGSLRSAASGEITYGGLWDGVRLVPNGELQLCRECNGNVLLVPAAVYDRLGMLDPVYPHALGDFDYAMRAYRAGISAYIAEKYVGTCEAHEKKSPWMRRDIGLAERMRFLYSPLGCPPRIFFYYERKNSGLARALLHFCTIHLRAVFPALWGGRKTFFRS